MSRSLSPLLLSAGLFVVIVGFLGVLSAPTLATFLLPEHSDPAVSMVQVSASTVVVGASLTALGTYGVASRRT